MKESNETPSNDCFDIMYDMINERIPTGFRFLNEYMAKRDFISHIVFWAYKNAYEGSPRKTIYEHIHLTSDSMDYERRRKAFDRNIAAMKKTKYADAERLGIDLDYYSLVSEKKRRRHDYGPSYADTDLEYKQISQYSPSTELKLRALLRQGSIVDSRKTTGQQIAVAYKEYYEYLISEGKAKDSKTWIENLLNIASFESQMFPSFLYAVTAFMKTNEVEVFPICLGELCEQVHYPAKDNPGNTRVSQSRFLTVRNDLIPYYFDYCEDEFPSLFQMRPYLYDLLGFQFDILAEFKNSPLVSETLNSIPIDSAKEYFKTHYNLFSVFSDPHWDCDYWSPKLVKQYREVVATFTESGAKSKSVIQKKAQESMK